MVKSPNTIAHPVSVVFSYHTAPKKFFECVQDLYIALVLNHREFGKDLKPGSHLRMGIDADEETTLSVDKSRYPLRIQACFMGPNVKSLRVLHQDLLIGAFPADCPLVRWIFTAPP